MQLEIDVVCILRSDKLKTAEGTVRLTPEPSRVSSSTIDSPGHEFVSDTVRPTDTDIEEVREGMKKLGMQPPKGKALIII